MTMRYGRRTSRHFDYVDKDGQMWLTELRRTHKADKD
jgi:hypothetical protein